MSAWLPAALISFSGAHRDGWNRRCHAVGIPAIAAASLGALSRLVIPTGDVVPFVLDGGVVLLLLTLLLDLWLSPRIAIGVFALGVALYLGARTLPWSGLGLLFAGGWIAQLVGHRVFEKNAPAFTDNAIQLFVGPRWLVNRVVRAHPDDPPPTT